MKTFDSAVTPLQEIVRALRAPATGALEEQRLVADIVAGVRDGGDEALVKFARQYDSPLITQRSLFVSTQEIEAANAKVDKEFLSALETASERIAAFHRRQLAGSWSFEEDGILLGQRFTPIERVACCVPSRAAPLPSSVLMTVVPARVAGAGEVIVMCPPKQDTGEVNPHILAAARMAGADRVLRVGGAHGVAALAFGTESVPKVHKIVGPGNVFVTLAKRMVFGIVGIDSLAGPSEIVVLADFSADPALVAAELLSQAEHSRDAVAVAVSDSVSLLAAVETQIQEQLPGLERSQTARVSLDENGALVRVVNLEQGIEFVNLFAPEHLQLAVSEPKKAADEVRNAGAIFLGQTTPEAFGDYIAGPSHVLPTGGTALFSSPLSVLDFLKCSSLLMCSRESLSALAPAAVALARVEGLTAHARAVAAAAGMGDQG